MHIFINTLTINNSFQICSLFQKNTKRYLPDTQNLPVIIVNSFRSIKDYVDYENYKVQVQGIEL